MLISAVNVMLHVMRRGIPRVRVSRALCGHGSRCMCARTGSWGATALMGRYQYVLHRGDQRCERRPTVTTKINVYTVQCEWLRMLYVVSRG